jgi:EAL domain-containing protein (putative c-di-GMP-specific phosphodiesterase class I)
VNVSPRSLHHSAFAGQIRDMLIRYSAPPSMLSLEITESLIMSDPDGSSRSLAELHEMGVRIVIDDFGTGYSSLSYLRRLPVDELKIDRSFVLGLSEGEDDTLVRCLIDLAHNLGLRVVAEGVETLEVCQQLTELGCDAAQGYFISRPGPAEEVAEWITRQRVFCSRAPASGIRVPGPRLLGS